MRRMRIVRSEEVDAYLAGLAPDRREALNDLWWSSIVGNWLA